MKTQKEKPKPHGAKDQAEETPKLPESKPEKQTRPPKLDFLRRNKLFISCYFACIISFAISGYLIFFPHEKELQLQGMYWFLIGVFCLILPSTGSLIDRINHLKFGEFEVNLIEVKKTLDKVEIIFRLNEYLASNENTTQNKTELTNDIKQAPENTLTLIYAAAADFREQKVYSILRIAKENEAERNVYRSRLLRLEPIFQALIGAKYAREDMLHQYYAQLAYVYKDQHPARWKLALDQITKAIEARDEKSRGDLQFGIYEFNRLVCRLNYNKDSLPAIKKELMEDFAVVNRRDGGIRYMLFGTSDYIAPGLKAWLVSNAETQAEYRGWLKENGKEQELLDQDLSVSEVQ